MKKPTFIEFKENIREQERLRGARMQAGPGLPIAVPFTDEEILIMWNDIQKEPPTGLYYHGEIKSLI